jgi:hypothetical protein
VSFSRVAIAIVRVLANAAYTERKATKREFHIYQRDGNSLCNLIRAHPPTDIIEFLVMATERRTSSPMLIKQGIFITSIIDFTHLIASNHSTLAGAQSIVVSKYFTKSWSIGSFFWLSGMSIL